MQSPLLYELPICQESAAVAQIEAVAQWRVSEGKAVVIDCCNSPNRTPQNCMQEASPSTDLAGQQTNSEHAEAGAALRDLRLSFPEDREGADLQARLRQGHQLGKS